MLGDRRPLRMSAERSVVRLRRLERLPYARRESSRLRPHRRDRHSRRRGGLARAPRRASRPSLARYVTLPCAASPSGPVRDEHAPCLARHSHTAALLLDSTAHSPLESGSARHDARTSHREARIRARPRLPASDGRRPQCGLERISAGAPVVIMRDVCHRAAVLPPSIVLHAHLGVARTDATSPRLDRLRCPSWQRTRSCNAGARASAAAQAAGIRIHSLRNHEADLFENMPDHAGHVRYDSRTPACIAFLAHVRAAASRGLAVTRVHYRVRLAVSIARLAITGSFTNSRKLLEARPAYRVDHDRPIDISRVPGVQGEWPDCSEFSRSSRAILLAGDEVARACGSRSPWTRGASRGAHSILVVAFAIWCGPGTSVAVIVHRLARSRPRF